MIEFDRVSIQLANRCLLENFSTTIQTGDRAVIVGPSGAGKSTLLRAIAGFIPLQSGSIRCCNVPVDNEHIQSVRELIAYTPQDFDDEGSVQEAIDRPYQFRANQQRRPDADRISATLDKLGLEKRILAQRVSQLSGGERQRIGILIAYLLDRPVWLLDEPTSALDPEARRRVLRLVFSAPDKTILSVSHDREWIRKCHPVIETGKKSKARNSHGKRRRSA
ncbi:MAG: ABC transporter ATP-binding protein [Leptospiraceae bacterium]|nr:ABC transporter ATP-binding protein [Leptospiraceae bacterium]